MRAWLEEQRDNYGGILEKVGPSYGGKSFIKQKIAIIDSILTALENAEPQLTEEELVEDLIPCPDCDGSGFSGRVLKEMARDAGKPEAE